MGLRNLLSLVLPAAAPPFQFRETGPLIDAELQLVPPQPRWADELLDAVRHPLTQQFAPNDGKLSREELERFLATAPLGHEPADVSKNRVPAYHFWMLLRHGPAGPLSTPPLRIAGGLNLRIGTTPAIEMYYGHFGYHVYPAARGHHYAERSCRLLLPLARAHGMRELWITTNPDNQPSRRTCERLGGQLVNIVKIPEGDPLHARGDREKCRYRVAL